MATHESAEMYLETIYVLSKAHATVRSIDVAEHMGFSKPSVSRAIGLLKQAGHVLMDKEGLLTLTESGRALAEKIFERHTVLTNLLTRLGVPTEIAAEDACKLEHVLSDVSFEAIRRHMEDHS